MCLYEWYGMVQNYRLCLISDCWCKRLFVLMFTHRMIGNIEKLFIYIEWVCGTLLLYTM